jgi:hypothetical protein
MAPKAWLKKRRVKVAIAGGLAVLVALFVLRAWIFPSSGVNYGNFRCIAEGMSQAEVEALMGGPGGPYDPTRKWQWGSYRLIGERGAGSQLYWAGEDSLICVWFDATGCVSGAEFFSEARTLDESGFPSPRKLLSQLLGGDD